MKRPCVVCSACSSACRWPRILVRRSLGDASAVPGWRGTAKVAITPKEPMWMSGYASRTKPSEGAVHDLWAKALAIKDPAEGPSC